MWQSQGVFALYLAHEHTRELELAAARHRLAREAGLVRSNAEPPRPSGFRSLIARPVRALGDAAHAVSDAACIAATRIEGRMA